MDNRTNTLSLVTPVKKFIKSTKKITKKKYLSSASLSMRSSPCSPIKHNEDNTVERLMKTWYEYKMTKRVKIDGYSSDELTTDSLKPCILSLIDVNKYLRDSSPECTDTCNARILFEINAVPNETLYLSDSTYGPCSDPGSELTFGLESDIAVSSDSGLEYLCDSEYSSDSASEYIF
jgi:hypothetical protein